MSTTRPPRDGNSGKLKNPAVLPLDHSIKGHKAVIIINKKPTFGTIQKVDFSLFDEKLNGSQFGKVFVTMWTEGGRSLHFNAVEKLSSGEFRLISDDVYRHWVSAKGPNLMDLLKGEQMLDRTVEGSKAMVIMKGKPVYGTVKKVSTMEPYRKLTDACLANDVIITIVSEEGSTFSFSARAKIELGEFKLITDEVYEDWVSADQNNVINQIHRSEKGIKIRKPSNNKLPFAPESPSLIELTGNKIPPSPTIEILDEPTKYKIVRHREPEDVRGELVLNASAVGKKALVFVDDKPIFGTIDHVEPNGVELFIHMVTDDTKTLEFEATEKIASDDFRIITNDVYEKWTAASEKAVLRSLNRKPKRKISGEKKDEELPIYKPFASTQRMSLKNTESKISRTELRATYSDGCYNLNINEKPEDLSKVEVGDIVQTRILNGKYKGSFFVRAEVLSIKEDTMDLRVLFPDKWQVAGTAFHVPKNLIRTVAESQIGRYTVPLELDLDHSIVFVQCNKKMKIKNLKKTVSKLRDIDACLLSFVSTDGRHLSDESRIPNDAVLCKVRQLGRVNTITERITEGI